MIYRLFAWPDSGRYGFIYNFHWFWQLLKFFQYMENFRGCEYLKNSNIIATFLLMKNLKEGPNLKFIRISKKFWFISMNWNFFERGYVNASFSQELWKHFKIFQYFIIKRFPPTENFYKVFFWQEILRQEIYINPSKECKNYWIEKIYLGFIFPLDFPL